MVDGPNVYGYVASRPTRFEDSPGLSFTESGESTGALGCAVLFGFHYLLRWGLPEELNTGKREHCFVACMIESACGYGMGDVAGEWIEYLQGHSGDGWSSDEWNGYLAASYGASIAAKGSCNTKESCVKGCTEHYAWSD